MVPEARKGCFFYHAGPLSVGVSAILSSSTYFIGLQGIFFKALPSACLVWNFCLLNFYGCREEGGLICHPGFLFYQRANKHITEALEQDPKRVPLGSEKASRTIVGGPGPGDLSCGQGGGSDVLLRCFREVGSLLAVLLLLIFTDIVTTCKYSTSPYAHRVVICSNSLKRQCYTTQLHRKRPRFFKVSTVLEGNSLQT